MKKNYGKEYEGVIRKTFIIGENGQILKRIDKVDTKNHSVQILKIMGF
jgi:thioredoxin-dependent peroxiredoxin